VSTSKTQIERKVTITYRWWNENGVKPEHIEALEESAWTRIIEMAELIPLLLLAWLLALIIL